MKNTPKSRQSNLVVQELEKELLIYDLSTNKAYVLNETSVLVYQFSNGKRTIQEIANLMSVKLKTLVSEDFVWLALNELKRDGLIENSDEMNEYLTKINRREVVKRIGFASMIALPIVSSVVAPTAATAASASVNLLGACTDPSECIRGTCKPCTDNCPATACCNNSGNQTFGTGHFLLCFPATANGFTRCLSAGSSCCSGSATGNGVGACQIGEQECVCR